MSAYENKVKWLEVVKYCIKTTTTLGDKIAMEQQAERIERELEAEKKLNFN